MECCWAHSRALAAISRGGRASSIQLQSSGWFGLFSTTNESCLTRTKTLMPGELRGMNFRLVMCCNRWTVENRSPSSSYTSKKTDGEPHGVTDHCNLTRCWNLLWRLREFKGCYRSAGTANPQLHQIGTVVADLNYLRPTRRVQSMNLVDVIETGKAH